MRLFIAIALDGGLGDALAGTMRLLEKRMARGRMVPRENLHVTLAFLGETGRDGEIREVMDGVSQPAFPVRLSSFGRFRREGGDVVWMGLEDAPALAALAGTLRAGLRARGFPMEERAFRAHITLGREVMPPPGLDMAALLRGLSDAYTDKLLYVDKIVLLKSERVRGRLVYTPLHETPLAE
jgi:2'-5' RNA ligase